MSGVYTVWGCHGRPGWDGAQPKLLAASLSNALPAVVLHLGVKCSVPWACNKDKILKTFLALSEKNVTNKPEEALIYNNTAASY